jgi:putative salt-induced outer membrane protein YdiY
MSRIQGLLAFCLLLAASASADQVVLKNGDRITGRITGLDGSFLHLKTEAMGELSLDWTQVESLQTIKPLTVDANGITVQAIAIRREEKNDTVEMVSHTLLQVSPGRVLSLVPDTTAAPAPHRRGLRDGWNSSLDAGLSAAYNTTNTTTVSIAGRAVRTMDDARLTFNYSSLYARTTDSTGTIVIGSDNVHGTARYERNYGESMFAFGFGNFETDRAQQLNLRDVFGGGTGYRMAQTGRLRMDVFTGATVNQESYSSSSSSDRVTGELLFGQDSSFSLYGRTSLASRLSLYPNLTLPGEYRLALDASASTQINHWLSWQVGVSDQYSSNPVALARANSVAFTAGLRLSLGKEGNFRPRTAEMKFTSGSY